MYGSPDCRQRFAAAKSRSDADCARHAEWPKIAENDPSSHAYGDNDANQIHQVGFKAQSALTSLRSSPRTSSTFTAPPAWVPEDVNAVISGISNLRKAAVAAA